MVASRSDAVAERTLDASDERFAHAEPRSSTPYQRESLRISTILTSNSCKGYWKLVDPISCNKAIRKIDLNAKYEDGANFMAGLCLIRYDTNGAGRNQSLANKSSTQPSEF